MNPATDQTQTTTDPDDSEEVPPNMRRANRWLLAALAMFAVALGVGCFLWMYGRMAGQRELERAVAPAMPAQTSDAAPTNPPEHPVAPR